MTTRRQFLQVGIASGVLLAGAGWFALRRGDGPAEGFARLDRASAAIVTALLPAILASALPDDPTSRATAVRETVEAFDRAVAGLAPATQEEIRQLLALLAMPPFRLAVAGVVPTWEAATAEDVGGFLSRWQSSRFGLLRSACQALTQLVFAAWYGNPSSWERIGYPGPPSLSG